MSSDNKTQLAIIGAGPAGYVAAFRAADLGVDVTLIDQEPRPGGVCLFRGCIPSKALIHAREVLGDAKAASEFGVEFQDPDIDIDKLREWKDGVITKLTKGLLSLAKKRKVHYLRAFASFKDNQTLNLEPKGENGDNIPEALSFDQCIIASGSRAFVPEPLQVDHPRVMGSREALNLPDIPERFLVVGGGYIGLELGQVYNGLGSKVTVVEMLDRLLPNTDPALVRPLQRELKKSFEAVHLETTVEKIEPSDDDVTVTLKPQGKDSSTETFDRVLIAAGRKPFTSNLGLENTDVELNEKGFVVVDKQQRTNVSNIYAIGDVTGGYMLAHAGFYEGKIAAEVISGMDVVHDANCVPAVIFSDPEIAYCGLTESEAKEKDIDFKTGKFPWSASGRALIIGQTKGFTRILTEPETSRILGVGIVGRGAGDLISEGALAVEMAAVAKDMALTIHPHPTLSETLMEAAEAADGNAIHAG